MFRGTWGLLAVASKLDQFNTKQITKVSGQRGAHCLTHKLSITYDVNNHFMVSFLR